MPDRVSRTGRLEKLIGLIPQAHCMFKVFYYKCDLIKRSEIDSCIKNELDSLASWETYDYFFLVNKIDESWQAVVWFWNDEKIRFSQNITHKLPAMAYYLSRCPAAEGVLVYHEVSSQSHESQWAVKWHGHQVIEQFYPLHSSLHVRNFRQVLQESAGMACFSNNPETSLLQESEVVEFNTHGKSQILSQGKCSAHFDIENPLQYWRGIVVFALLIVTYISLDGLLLSYQSNQVDQSIEALQASTAPLQKQLQKNREQSNFLQAFFRAKARQQSTVKVLESLTKSLPADIVIERFTLESGKLILEGTIIDTKGLLDALSGLPEVRTAKLLGDVLPTADGRQKFRAELVLKEAYSWTN